MAEHIILKVKIDDKVRDILRYRFPEKTINQLEWHLICAEMDMSLVAGSRTTVGLSLRSVNEEAPKKRRKKRKAKK